MTSKIISLYHFLTKKSKVLVFHFCRFSQGDFAVAMLLQVHEHHKFRNIKFIETNSSVHFTQVLTLHLKRFEQKL